MIAQVLKAVHHCHHRGVTHRDIKLENILFSKPESDSLVQVIDFGLSNRFLVRNTVINTHIAAIEEEGKEGVSRKPSVDSNEEPTLKVGRSEKGKG